MTELDLNKLFYLNIETARLQKDLIELEHTIEVKSPIITGMPRGGVVRDNSDRVAELVDLKKLISLNLEKIQLERGRLERYIGNIEDAEMRLIFRLRHVNGMSWEKIGEEVGYTKSGVFRKYQRYWKNVNKFNEAM